MADQFESSPRFLCLYFSPSVLHNVSESKEKCVLFFVSMLLLKMCQFKFGRLSNNIKGFDLINWKRTSFSVFMYFLSLYFYLKEMYFIVKINLHQRNNIACFMNMS